MTDQSDGQPEKTVRVEAAWKQEREAIAERNQRTQRAGREQREAYERGRSDARRSAEAKAHARLLGAKRKG